MNAGFTPGPWRSFPTPDDPDMICEVCVDDGPVCAVYGRQSEDANASLITAAPDLYAACEEALEEDSGLACAQQLRAALAKARGDA